MKNNGMNNGLFGKLALGDVEPFEDWRDVSKLVYKNTKEKITMFRSINSVSKKQQKKYI